MLSRSRKKLWCSPSQKESPSETAAVEQSVSLEKHFSDEATSGWLDLINPQNESLFGFPLSQEPNPAKLAKKAAKKAARQAEKEA